LNRSWGYNARDTQFKTPEQIISALVGAAGRGANLLLNVGPRPDGTIGPPFVERLSAVGKWLEANGNTIYGTRKGPIAPQPWGISTVRVDAPFEVYIHVLQPADSVAVPRSQGRFAFYAFGKTTPLPIVQHETSIELKLPETARTPIDTIVVLIPIAQRKSD
jgi:alpha-L-fucosidase